MKNFGLIYLFILLALVACQPATEETTPATESPVQDEGLPQPTPTSEEAPSEITETPAGYPPPASPTESAEGYPPPPTSPATADPYPTGEFVWILRPVGEQCADAGDNLYADLQEAVASLAAAGVPVERSEMVELMVCQACGCPTSAHYRVQIEAPNLNKAVALGWIREQG